MGIEDHVPEGFEIPEESSALPSFWNHFWQESVTPWDLGEPHPELVARIGDLGQPRSVYVPGCGRGHDALFLSQKGYHVTAVDMAPDVQPHLAAGLNEDSSRFLLRNAFDLEDGETYSLWWDHTFFCAIPPESREQWGETVLSVMPEGGELAALVFPVGKPLEDGGPPYGISAEEMLEVLGPRASLRFVEPVGHAGRDGKELFALIDIAPQS